MSGTHYYVIVHVYICMYSVYVLVIVSSLQTKNLVGEIMKEAAFSLAEANFAAGDFRHVINTV